MFETFWKTFWKFLKTTRKRQENHCHSNPNLNQICFLCQKISKVKNFQKFSKIFQVQNFCFIYEKIFFWARQKNEVQTLGDDFRFFNCFGLCFRFKTFLKLRVEFFLEFLKPVKTSFVFLRRDWSDHESSRDYKSIRDYKSSRDH